MTIHCSTTDENLDFDLAIVREANERVRRELRRQQRPLLKQSEPGALLPGLDDVAEEPEDEEDTRGREESKVLETNPLAAFEPERKGGFSSKPGAAGTLSAMPSGRFRCVCACV